VPGTGLAGALRGWLATHLDEQSQRRLWGYQQGDQGHASFFLVEDGLVTLPAGVPQPEVRDGVGLDRVTGAAAPSILYTRAVLPRGTTIDFTLQLELLAADVDLGQAVLGRLVQALREGEVRLGAARTRGLGRVKLVGPGGRASASIEDQRLESRQGVLQALRGQGQSTPLKDIVGQTLPEGAVWREDPKLVVEVDWQAELPVMSKADAEGLAVDLLPRVTTGSDGQSVWLLLAGAGIKGALRTQAERILRTLRSHVASQDENPRQRFLLQLAEVDALLEGLFGRAKTGTDQDSKAAGVTGPPLPGRGALTVADCHGGRRPKPPQLLPLRPLATRAQWASIGQAKPSELMAALEQAGLRAHPTGAGPFVPEGLQQAFHIAVDRWTGGVAPGALYSVLEPHGLAWESIRLELDLGRLLEGQRLPAVALLLLLLEDLAARRIPLGFGAQRGLGALSVQAVTFTPRGLEGSPLGHLGRIVPTAEGRLALPEPVRVALHEAWTRYLSPPATEALPGAPAPEVPHA